MTTDLFQFFIAYYLEFFGLIDHKCLEHRNIRHEILNPLVYSHL